MPGHCSATCRVRSVLRSTTTMMRTAGPSGWRSLKAAFAVTSASRQRGSRDSSLRAGTTTPTLRIPMVSAGPCWSAKPGMFDVSAPTAGRAHFGLRHCFGERRHVTSPSRRATDRAGEGVSTSSRKSPSTCSASTARPDSWRMRRCTSSPTEFLRSDELPGDAAIGYLAVDRPRTNVFHLPVLGSRDGGIYTTVADVHALWAALDAGRIVPMARVAQTLQPRSEVPTESKRYGLGFWLDATGPAAMLEGMDAGVSFHSRHDDGAGLTWTVVSNTTDGAWPIVRHLAELLRW